MKNILDSYRNYVSHYRILEYVPTVSYLFPTQISSSSVAHCPSWLLNQNFSIMDPSTASCRQLRYLPWSGPCTWSLPQICHPTCRAGNIISWAVQLVGSNGLTQVKAAQVAVATPVRKLLLHSSPQHSFKVLLYLELCREAEEALWHRGKQSSPHAALFMAILGACAKANAAWRLRTRVPAVASPLRCVFFGSSSCGAMGTLQW